MTPRLRDAALAIGIAALALATFAPARDFEFLSYDDWIHVRNNPHVELGLGPEGLARAFSPAFYHANWIPLTSISYLVDYALAGLDPARFHRTNLWLHALAAALLFLALRRLSGAVGPSAFAAAVFAVHPLQVEPVVWISSRKDVLAGVCFAAVLLAYARHAERPSAPRFALVFVATLLGLMAKQSVVTLPFVLLLLDSWPLGRPERGGPHDSPSRLVGEKLVLLVPVVAVSILVLRVQAVVWEGGHPLDVRIANAAESLLAYLRSTFWPSGLAAFYPHPRGATPAGRLLLAGFVLTSITLFAAGARRRFPYLLVGWLWFLGMLVPVLGLVEVGLQARADRYMYLPLIGLALMLGFGARDLAARSASARRALPVAACALLLALCWGSRSALPFWRDSESLYRRAIQVIPDNYVAHYGLAGILAGEGRLDAAREELGRAIAADPGWLLPYRRLAEVEIARGEPEAAAGLYRRLLAARPEDASLHVALAGAVLRAGDARSAAEHYRAALALGGPDSEAAQQLAWLLATHPDPELRDAGEAQRLARLALGAYPRSFWILDTLAAAHAAGGDPVAAARLAEEAAGLADEAARGERARAIRERLALYRSGRPFLQTPPLAPKIGAHDPQLPW